MMKHLMAATFLVAAALTVPQGAALAASPPNMLVIGTNLTGIRTLDPADNNARTVSELISNIYDNLVQLPQNDLQKLQPMLATKWSASADGKLITITLRSDATFQSGNPVTAEDAAWSIQRVIKRGQVGSTDIALWGFTADNVEKLVRAKDAQTLEIELPIQVSIDLVLYSLASSSLGIVDKKTAMSHEANGDFGAAWLAANSAGSGPFTLSQWRPNDIAVFEANKKYWGGVPAMARVITRHIPESGNLRLQLQAGDVDVGQYLASGDLDALANDKKMVIDNVPGLGFYYIALNQKDPDLQKPLVREAFQHAFDWKAISGNIMRYTGFPWQSVVPKGMIGAPADNTSRYDYDPAKAKALLAQAGYPNGLKKVLNPSGAATLPFTEALQASARAAGFDLNLVPGEYTPAFRERKYEILLGNSGARLPDPFAVATQYAYNPDNRDEARLGSYYLWRTAMQVPELNTLVDQSMKERDTTKRTEIFKKIDEIYKGMNPPLIVFFQRTDPYVIRANVKGYQGHTTWSTRWHDVTKTKE
ncbi:Putative ABC transport system periplasmic binding protein [Neorhizobium galegae bv. orientalis]|uniref:Putative ABC transport system periplasmic binding protein n=2 Tax=Neorhizobium galegae TaxID=399 RepID=A0A068T165_NEOGA|nr:Putative ABC transport system periplasmic binding protein [Neorhizobium galegae bv. orientalis str. HAMBI 540]CDZ43381.1 Putative ABC transport system periplasmic binding protein [Neorhizobium galegae bv. orientalis]